MAGLYNYEYNSILYASIIPLTFLHHSYLQSLKEIRV